MTAFDTNGKSPRDFTREERRARFQALKATLTEEEPDPAPRLVWHEVDPEGLTPAQYAELPPGRPGIDSRSRPVWVRYRHRARRRVVIAKGVFDHECGQWMARYYPAADGDLVREVEVTAWAYIVRGVMPDSAPVIPSPPGGGI